MNGGHGHQVQPILKEDKKATSLGKSAIAALQTFGQKFGKSDGKRSNNGSFDMPSMVSQSGLDLLSKSGVHDLLGLGNAKRKVSVEM